jgi:galactokinase
MFPDELFLGMTLYDICLTVGAVMALLVADSFSVKRGFSVALQKGLLIAGLSAIFVGYGFAVLFQSVYNWIETKTFALVGATFYGGLIGGAGLFLILWFFVLGRFCKDKDEPKKRFPELADVAAVAIPMAHGFGRLGCLFAGCCHGRIVDVWYALPMRLGGEWVRAVPIQLFEACFLFALAAVLAWLLKTRRDEKRFPLLPVYMTAYGVWRFFIEYARADDRGQTILSFLTPSQLTAVLLVAVGVAYFVFWYRFKRRTIMEKTEAMKQFELGFGAQPTHLFSAAGRINVIGEHVDYCGGKVFPAALNLCCNIYARKTEGNLIRIILKGIEGVIELEIDKLNDYRGLKLGNYQAGVAYHLQKIGTPIVPCDLYYDCTVPFGSGLSSSASIEVATAVALCELAGVPYEKKELAVLSQRAENEYAGVNCGIMDQFASAMGKKDHAVLLDCATLEYEYVPLELGEYCLVVANCNKPHNLVESKYNVRRHEVETALKAIQTVKNVACLAELTPADFNEVKYLLSGIIEKRAEHVVCECDRVNQAVAALKAGDIVELGHLLNESHYSLRDLYEVTGKELDTLSELARKEKDCLGSRMIGAGFGGCTISIVKKSAVDGFIKRVGTAYFDAIGYRASFYQTSIEDGVTVEVL